MLYIAFVASTFQLFFSRVFIRCYLKEYRQLWLSTDSFPLLTANCHDILGNIMECFQIQSRSSPKLATTQSLGDQSILLFNPHLMGQKLNNIKILIKSVMQKEKRWKVTGLIKMPFLEKKKEKVGTGWEFFSTSCITK